MEYSPHGIEETIYKFFSGYPARTYPKDNIMVFAGERSPCIYYIDSGKVTQYDISYRGDEVIVNIFKPGAFFSIAWVFADDENKYFYKAELRTKVYCAPKADVFEFMVTHNEATLDLVRRIYRGVDGVLARAVHLMTGSARERALYELALECRRFGHVQSDGSVLLDIGEKELAARAGLARETISRELSGLKVKGIVMVGPQGIGIRQPEALARLLDAHR